MTEARRLNANRTRGTLLGLAVGDALGTTLEFSTPRCPPLPELVGGPHREVTGGGPFKLASGQVTDDTHMAACLSASLVAHGKLEIDDVARRYLKWRDHAFDVGAQISAVLTRIKEGQPPIVASHALWVERDRHPAGNGSLMRTAPIAIFYAHDAHQRREASCRESAITHFDPRCQLACAVFNSAISTALCDQSESVDPSAMLEAAHKELDEASTWLGVDHPDERPVIEAGAQMLRDDLQAARQNDPEIYSDDVHLLDMLGYVRVAFRLAFWHLLHSDDYERALIDVVNRGGDSDTNGAITGALLGACLGANAIPKRWQIQTMNALQDKPNEAPFADEYHPKTLLRILDALNSDLH